MKGGRGDRTGQTEELRARWQKRLLPTYPVPPVAFVQGRGATLLDAEGRTYLDFLSGLAVTSLGHAHPAVARAVAEQAALLTHTSNLFITEPAVALAEKLAELAGWDDGRVFFANSGAEANEAALKLARRHGLAQRPDKYRVVALEGSFHGRTLATLEATGQPEKHEPFAPLAGFVDHVAYDDADALVSAVTPRTCAVLLEVVQGEGGVRPVPGAVLRAAREACDRHGALLVVDEVQTGVGRTGHWFAWQASPVTPDVMTLSKALGNGLPIGACVARGAAAEAFGPGDHATTFGGNPVAAAAALAVLRTMEEEGLVARAADVGRLLSEGLEEIVRAHPLATGVRGRGALLALELGAPMARRAVETCRERGLLVNAVGPALVRLAPPLVLSRQEAEAGLERLAEAVETVAREGDAAAREGDAAARDGAAAAQEAEEGGAPSSSSPSSSPE